MCIRDRVKNIQYMCILWKSCGPKKRPKTERIVISRFPVVGSHTHIYFKGFNWGNSGRYLKFLCHLPQRLPWMYSILNWVLTVVGNAILTNPLREQWGGTRKRGKVPLVFVRKPIKKSSSSSLLYLLHHDVDFDFVILKKPYFREGGWIAWPRSVLVSLTWTWIIFNQSIIVQSLERWEDTGIKLSSHQIQEEQPMKWKQKPNLQWPCLTHLDIWNHHSVKLIGDSFP